MPNTNGHGHKRAILYARVSTDEQARSRYSLAQQIEALRAVASRAGYEVLEEVQDPEQSGASLERPGMDRVRDLASGLLKDPERLRTGLDEMIKQERTGGNKRFLRDTTLLRPDYQANPNLSAPSLQASPRPRRPKPGEA